MCICTRYISNIKISLKKLTESLLKKSKKSKHFSYNLIHNIICNLILLLKEQNKIANDIFFMTMYIYARYIR